MVGPNGWMDLNGTNIDITRSGLVVAPVWNEAFGSPVTGPIPTNYANDLGIYDEYWVQASFSDAFPMNSAALWNGSVATAPGEPMPPSAPTPAPGFSFAASVADSYINVVGALAVTGTNFDGSTYTFNLPTNITKGAVFVGLPSGFGAQIGFTPSPSATNFFNAAQVLLGVSVSNSVNTAIDNALLYIQDTLASRFDFRGISSNVLGCPAVTARPINYLLQRSNGGLGAPGNNGYPEPRFFLDSGAGINNTNIGFDSVSNAVITAGDYAGYGAFADNVVFRPPALPTFTITNYPGRIRIHAQNLTMADARIHAEGEIMIQTENLISSSNAVVDCENLSFNLASTNDTLQVQNLSMNNVARMRGPIFMWSGTWGNNAEVVITNNWAFVTNTDGSVTETNVPLTNEVTIGFAATLVDATSLFTLLPVTVFDFVTHTPNLFVGDNMRVAQSFFTDAQSFTIGARGSLEVLNSLPINPVSGFVIPGPPLRNWVFTNAPNLLFLTNYGTLTVDNEAHFGDDRSKPYDTFVNTGTLSGASIAIDSSFFQNSGTISAGSGITILGIPGGGPLEITCDNGILANGSSTSAGNTEFFCTDLKITKYSITANATLNFTVSDNLSDGGGTSGNSFTMYDGFNLFVKPNTGDLLGTSFTTTAPKVPSVEVDHSWAGEDRGVSTDGYHDDVAIGKLSLTSQSPDPFFFFAGATGQNGLYVDLLDLSALGTTYTNWMDIDPSLTIYYAAARLGFTPPPNSSGIPQEPEEYLDGQFGGHLRWVSSFAGPNSTVMVIINGVPTPVNSALRFSKIIDSDGDGIPNFYDATPFGGLSLSASLVGQLKSDNSLTNAVGVSWFALSNKVYTVEYATNLLHPTWNLLLKYTNNAHTNRNVTVLDTNAPAIGSRRFYRVGYTQ